MVPEKDPTGPSGLTKTSTMPPEDVTEPPPTYLTGVRLFMVMVALMLGMFLIALDMNIVSTAIPKITDEFHSVDSIGWYASSFFLTLACFQAPWGKACTYFPLKSSFFASIVLFETGSLITAVSQNNTTFIVGRAITGVGGAGITGGAFIITAFSAPPDRVAVYLGVMGAIFCCASVCGPLLGGVFTDEASWRWCFYLNLPVGGFVLLILFFFFHEPASHRPTAATVRTIFLQMDPLGVVLIVAAMVCYCLALEWGGVTQPWSASKTVGTLVGWILLSLAFIVDQWLQGSNALIAASFLKRREIAVCCAFIFFLNSANFLLLYNLPIYFQAINSDSPMGSGIRILPLMISSSFSTLLSGALLNHVGGRFHIFLLGGSTLLTIGAGLIYTLGIHPTPAQYIGYQILVGIGVGGSIQIPVIVAQAMVDTLDKPIVTSMVLFFQLISGALSVSAAQSIFNNKLISGLRVHAPSVSVAEVFAAGATEIRGTFPNSQLPGILLAYEEGIKASWAMGIALSGMAVLVSLVPVQRLQSKQAVGTAMIG